MYTPNSLLNNRYQIINKIGQGGNATTYLAKDTSNNENVVIKVLSIRQLDNFEKLELFEREAKILKQLNHPAIPQYIDYFDEDTKSDRCFYLVQQFAPGKSLATLIEEGWKPDEKTVKNIAEQIFKILIYLQQSYPPVIHRDIKPHNLIYCFPEDQKTKQGKIFLVDFGAVQDTYRHTITNSLVVGTPGYMAPEQMYGKTTLSTDLYGLGKTLLFLLTGKSPENLPSKKRKTNFRHLVNISPQFADWIEQLIDPNISERFPNAQTALDVLEEKQPSNVRKPANTSVKIEKGYGSLNIHIPPAITRKNSNLILGYLGLGWNVLLVLFIVKFYDFFVLSNIRLNQGFIAIILIILNITSMIFIIKMIFSRQYLKENYFYILIMTLLMTFSLVFLAKDISSSITILTIGILLSISEYFWGSQIRKGSLKDLLCKQEINIYNESIYLKTYFFNRLVDFSIFSQTNLRKIIANQSIILEYGYPGLRTNIDHQGLLLTTKEKNWLVSEIKNHLKDFY